MEKILLALCMVFSTVYAEIQEIHQIEELETLASSPFKGSEWVLFDIDYTLTEPAHPALQMSVIKQNKQRFKEEFGSFTKEEIELIPALMVTQVPNQLTDPLVPSLIKKFQDQNIAVLGFTAMDTSTLPEIGSIPVWRVNELKRLGIHFDPKIAPFVEESLVFTEFPPFRGSFPLYQEGILYSNVIPSKGAVLSAFLDKVKRKPSKIIFIDDTLENLQNVESELEKHEIPFLGIHYKADTDPTKIPQVTDEEWREVWDGIRERAKQIIDDSSTFPLLKSDK